MKEMGELDQNKIQQLEPQQQQRAPAPDNKASFPTAPATADAAAASLLSEAVGRLEVIEGIEGIEGGGSTKDSEPGSASALSAEQMLLGTMPRTPQFMLARRDGLREEAVTALGQGQFGQAATTGTHAYRLGGTFYGRSHPDMLPECVLLACAHHKRGRTEQSHVFLAEARRLAATAPYEEPAINAALFSVIGEIAGMMDDREAAMSIYHSYLEAMRHHYGSTHLAMSDAYTQLSRLHTSFGELAPALDFAEKALVVRLGRLGKDSAAVADARYNLGVIHLLLGSSHDAHREFTSALEVHVEPSSEEGANLRYGLAMAEHQLGAHEAAHGHYNAARRVRQSIYGASHPLVAEIDLCLKAVREDTDARMARQMKSRRL